MKVIISHDVDHITAWEHYNDFIIPKHIGRSFLEWGFGYISLSEVLGRLKSILINKWHNLESLLEFNKKNAIPATFFFAVSNGKGLNYSLTHAEFWVKKVICSGFDAGVHGIHANNYEEIKMEHDLFKKISGLDSFGIRMHYLNCDEATLDLLSRTNYLFDCSNMNMSNPVKFNNLWVFPLNIMDSSIFETDVRWQNINFVQSIEVTRKIFNDVCKAGVDYLTILFHDIYFSNNFRTWKNWYIWLIKYIKDNNIEFISFRDAIKELEGGSN